MEWNQLTSVEQLDEIKQSSSTDNILIFKHSTRCPTSSMALNRLERNWTEDNKKTVTPFFLDLISYRDVSNAIASDFSVMHESPQVLVIKNGKCVYNESHLAISLPTIMDQCQ